jgi:prepilin-type processing-associated H-X9-DG protein
LLTILYDRTGKHYHRGRGLMLFVDGHKRASRSTLGTLKYTLKPATP